ncbi:MAG: 2-oxo acid dehydrogenase subunit E2 [Chitinophagales bacterium]|nr:2-oxo acid dehydrogenase subunit E2 [Chitinophagales bacterium]
MAEAIRLGRMTDTMEEGFMADITIKVGDVIKVGDAIAEVETDKATLPLESYFAGKVLHVQAKKGDSLKIGDLIAIVGKEGENFDSLLTASATPAQESTAVQTPSQANTPVVEIPAAPAVVNEPSLQEGRVKASPLAKKLAEDKGIDIRSVKGSGEDGRIVKRDLENYTQVQPTRQFVGKESFKEVRVSQMRKAIARRLSDSFFTAPHFYLTADIHMDKAVVFRTELNEIKGQKVSFNDLVVKAVALALREHPAINASWLGETIRYNEHIHIGIAVAVEEGLVVPVVRFADGKDLSSIATESKTLAQKATSKKLLPEDMQGNTFTVSNLGMFGIEEFTAIINTPDACILSVGALRDEVAVVNGQIQAVKRMKITLGCDHRVVDGATGAKFLQAVRKNLEEPLRLVL